MYENFYSLRASPFRLSPDPDFFFGSKGHKRALAYLKYGLTQKEGFIVITGTPGTGKTTLARALLQEIGREKVVVAELNTTHLAADDVLRMVASSYGIKHEGASKATILKKLESYCLSRFKAGFHVLLLIDEAQNLPTDSIEELRMLSNFYHGNDALIQIFLLGQEQFRDSLYSSELEQLRQRVVASCHLEPLGQSETKQYILHRLKHVGWKQDPRFSERAFARIYSLTKGVPRRINTFCDRLFLYGSLEDIHEFKDETIKAVASELMMEITPSGKKLSDIKPAKEQAENTENEKPVDLDASQLDSDKLTSFDDDIEEQELEQNIDKPKDKDSNKSTEIEASNKENSLEEKILHDRKDKVNESKSSNQAANLRIVAKNNNNTAEETSFPEIVPKTDQDISETKPRWWDLVAEAVAFYKTPENFSVQSLRERPLLPGTTELFKIALGKLVVPQYLRIDSMENVTDEELRLAIIFYISDIMLFKDSDYYRRLGVQNNEDFENIRLHYKYLFRLFQPEKGDKAKDWDESYTRIINQAYATLRSEPKRKEYDNYLSEAITGFSVIDEDSEKSYQESPTSLLDESWVIKYDDENPSSNNENAKQGVSIGVWILFLILLISLGIGGYYYSNPAFQNKVMDFLQSNEIFKSYFKNDETVSSVSQNIKIIEETSPIDENRSLITDSKRVLQESSEKPITIVKNKPIDSPKLEKEVNLEQNTKIEKSAEKPVPLKSEKKTNAKKIDIESKPLIKEPKIIEKETKNIKTIELVDKEKRFDKTVKPDPQPPIKSSKLKTPEKTLAPQKILRTNVPNQIPVEKSKPAARKEEKITSSNLNKFIDKFSIAYKNGDLNKFMGFFAEDAKTNDAESADIIRSEYRVLFKSTDFRTIEMKKLDWRIKKSEATGRGDFSVTVLRKGSEIEQEIEGKIRVIVEKKSEKFYIKGLYHTYNDVNEAANSE